MDCTSAHEHLAAWLDDELSASARTLLERHLASCVDCRALADSLEAQDLSPPEGLFDDRPPEFWGAMDAALDAEWERQLRSPPSAEPEAPWYRRTVALPVPAVLAYAALTLLMAGWMLGGTPQGTVSEVPSSPLASTELSAPEAVTTEASEAAPVGAWTVATYTPHRGTF